MSKPKKIPEFKTEAEERAFWESHDSARLSGLAAGEAGIRVSLQERAFQYSGSR